LKGPVPAEGIHSGDLPEYDLCPRCERQLFAQWGLPLQNFLDGLEAPVVVMDGDALLKAANRAACAMLGKEIEVMQGLPGGLVFECAHAFEPGGCGHTIHCSGCVIRHCVTDTHATGAQHVRVPAALDCRKPEGEERVQFLVSTLRRDDMVLLKIEDAPAAET
jgi:PAS domain-containing protein